MAVSLGRMTGAIAAALFIVSCGGSSDSPTTVPTTDVASVVIAPDSILMIPGRVAQLYVAVRDAKGATLSGRSVTWKSADNAKVAVSQTGEVTAIAVGRVKLTATSEGKTASIDVVVSATLGRDFGIVDAQFTQGVQDAAGSIPMIRFGSGAAVNVLIASQSSFTSPTQIVLRLFDANGSVVYTDTALTRSTLGAAPTYSAPSAQFFVPNSRLVAGVRWQLLRDPRGILADDSPANDVFPRTSPATLATADVPPLNIRFVPISLASNSNSSPLVTEDGLPDYLRTLRSVLPIGVINTHIGALLMTTANFGTAPNGGDLSFWAQVLSELDLARIADPTESTWNWYGVIAPPPGFTFTSFGGISYIPPNGQAAGAATRTSVAVRTGWFNQPTQARDLVAHELSHTFGRRHAPCGAAGSPLDQAYPVVGGVLDAVGHDVYSWERGLAATAAAVPTNTGDVMGYCFPAWASTYTNKAVLAFRGPAIVAVQSNVAERTRTIVVRGSIENEQTIKLEPTFTLSARPTTPEPTDAFHVEGRAANGRVLFVSSFTPAIVDHAPNLKHFTVAVPVTAEIENDLAEIVVRGSRSQARVTRAASASPKPTIRATATRRLGAIGTTVSCEATSARGIVLIDEVSGSVIGSAAGATIVLPEGVSKIAALCSDGLSTTRSSIVIPR